jgi:hypothetical protein
VDPKVAPVYSLHLHDSTRKPRHLTTEHVHLIKGGGAHGDHVHQDDSGIFPCGSLRFFSVISDIVLLLQCFYMALVVCMNSKEAVDYWGGRYTKFQNHYPQLYRYICRYNMVVVDAVTGLVPSIWWSPIYHWYW